MYVLYFYFLAKLVRAALAHMSTTYLRTRLSSMSPVSGDCRVTALTDIIVPAADDPPKQWPNFRDAVFAAAKTATDQACQDRPLHLHP